MILTRNLLVSLPYISRGNSLKFILILTFLSVSIIPASAQRIDKRLQDTVFLADGRKYLGIITRYKPEQQKLGLYSAGGGRIDFQTGEIERIGWSERSLRRWMPEGVQSPEALSTVDVVYLKDGSTLRGQLLEYVPGERVRLKLSNTEVTITAEDLLKVVQEPVDNQYLRRMKRQYNQVYRFPETGWYLHPSLYYLPGGGENRADFGMGIQAIAGYQFTRWLGLGAGLALDDYSGSESGSTYLPAFVEIRSYLFRTRRTPYVTFAGGYGFTTRPNAEIGQWSQERQGGMMIYPAIGYRLSGKQSKNLTIDLGYKFQHSTVEDISGFNEEIITRRITYRRLSIRLGMIF